MGTPCLAKKSAEPHRAPGEQQELLRDAASALLEKHKQVRAEAEEAGSQLDKCAGLQNAVGLLMAYGVLAERIDELEKHTDYTQEFRAYAADACRDVTALMIDGAAAATCCSSLGSNVSHVIVTGGGGEAGRVAVPALVSLYLHMEPAHRESYESELSPKTRSALNAWLSNNTYMAATIAGDLGEPLTLDPLRASTSNAFSGSGDSTSVPSSGECDVLGSTVDVVTGGGGEHHRINELTLGFLYLDPEKRGRFESQLPLTTGYALRSWLSENYGDANTVAATIGEVLSTNNALSQGYRSVPSLDDYAELRQPAGLIDQMQEGSMSIFQAVENIAGASRLGLVTEQQAQQIYSDAFADLLRNSPSELEEIQSANPQLYEWIVDFANNAEALPTSTPGPQYPRGMCASTQFPRRCRAVYGFAQNGDPDIEPPDRLVQPVRGFGWVWRNGPEVRERLGWATKPEKGHDSPAHDFERGTIIRTGGSVYVLLRANGGAARWLRR